ncbi:MAG: serine/threonine protein kinase [Tannerellaceae bacterium]|jgi:serine/threonine-protein kinase|nr:serine/threonine protein kinase [Tannerellaceae bacterium]
MNLPAGHHLQNKKYQLLQVVGRGGFGITYKGILFTEVKGPLGAIKTEVPISIKEYFFKDYCYRAPDGFNVQVHSETGRFLFRKFKEKLIKEARILSEVHHPHIVNVLDVFEENNTAYIAMEYIAGYSLKNILEKEGVLPEAKALKYLHQTGKALQFVHEKNILHLDIKPSNILIDKNDNARLIDFGVSKRYDTEDRETSTTMLTLSKGFASIEQYDNEGTQLFSPCPDIYSLGATLYNLLTGRIPTESILRATRPFPAPSVLNPDITAGTETVILKAMQINPTDRFQTIKEMLTALPIPPPEDKPENNFQESDLSEETEEDTLFLTGKNNLQKTPDTANRKKKSRKGVFLIFLICIFAAVGAVILLVGENNGSVAASPEVPPVVIPPEEETTTKEGEEENTRSVQPMTNQTETNRQEPQQTAVKPTAGEGMRIELMPVSQPTIEEIEAEYTALIASGKEKMEAGDYTGADEDFSKAITLKATNEAKQLLISNASKAEEKRIADKIALYEEKTNFGKYKIVRRKSTGKYGAIDSKGEEHIPCKYVYVGIAGENRAFQREDNVFDIYNANGILIRSDVTY